MQNTGWGALLRFIPAHLHEKLMLKTSNGTEIAVQNFLRIEAEMLMIKGRLAGSQDTGRLYFVPLQNIDYVGTSTEVKDSEFEEWFAGLVMPAEAAPAAVAAPVPAHVSAPTPLPQTIPAVAAAGQPGSDVRPSVRSEVLERFRSRGTGGGPASSVNLPRPGG